MIANPRKRKSIKSRHEALRIKPPICTNFINFRRKDTLEWKRFILSELIAKND